MKKSIILGMLASFAMVGCCKKGPVSTSSSSCHGSDMETSGLYIGGEASRHLIEFAGSDRVLFRFDSSQIKEEDMDLVRQQAEWINKQNYDSKGLVIIEGHCDERGTSEYNLALGLRRSTALKNALVEYGVDPKILKTVSYGKERPAIEGHDQAAWAQSRRSVIVFSQSSK